MTFANGGLSGTPTQAGTFIFVIQVLDATGKKGSGKMSLTVNEATPPPPPPPPNLNPPPDPDDTEIPGLYGFLHTVSEAYVLEHNSTYWTGSKVQTHPEPRPLNWNGLFTSMDTAMLSGRIKVAATIGASGRFVAPTQFQVKIKVNNQVVKTFEMQNLAPISSYNSMSETHMFVHEFTNEPVPGLTSAMTDSEHINITVHFETFNGKNDVGGDCNPEYTSDEVNPVPIKVVEVCEKDQKWNKAPSPKRPHYDNEILIPSDQLHNYLYLAVEPQSEKAELIVKSIGSVPGVTLLCGLIERETGNVLPDTALVAATGMTDFSFTPTGSINDKSYRVVLGLDKDRDGTLSVEEIITNSVPPKDSMLLRVVTSSDYQDNYDYLDWRDNVPGLYVARKFLQYFDGNSASIGEATLLPPSVANITDKKPTHIAGSAYNPVDGSTAIATFLLPDGSIASDKIESTFNRQDNLGLRSVIANTFISNGAILGEPFEQDANLDVYTSPPVTIQSGSVISFYGPGMMDLNFAYGGANIKSGTIVFRLVRDTSDPGIVRLSALTIDAIVEDLYDFDWTRLPSSQSRKAAIVQIGWQEPQRKAGRIFYTNTIIKKTYDDDGAIRNFSNNWCIQLAAP